MKKKKLKRAYVIAIDVDGTLCTGEAYSSEECLKAKPREDVIKKVNELYRRGFIVIWTARQDHLIPATLEWLRKNGVKFNAISNNKMASDFYIDDKCKNVEDFLKE